MLLRLILRWQGLAAGALCVLGGALMSVQFSFLGSSASPLAPILFGLALGVATGAANVFVLVRFGLLSMAAGFVCGTILDSYPVSFDFSKPYAGAALFGLLVVAAYAVYGFRVALGGQEVFGDALLEAPRAAD